MSRRNGDKAREALQKRRRNVQRMKDRSERARLTKKAAPRPPGRERSDASR
jgi:hypothetical protein